MYYFNNELPPQQGWVCPKCGRVNAPWLPICGCVSSQTSGTPYLVKTSSISQDSHEIAKDEPQTEARKFLGFACETCKHRDEEWDSEACDGCCENNDHYEPKDEPQTCEECEHWNDTEDGCADRHGCKTDCAWGKTE